MNSDFERKNEKETIRRQTMKRILIVLAGIELYK